MVYMVKDFDVPLIHGLFFLGYIFSPPETYLVFRDVEGRGPKGNLRILRSPYEED